jgi:tape measure domain-containing protein
VAVSSVELIVNAAKAVNPLRQVKKAAKDASQSFGKLQSAAGRTAGSFQKLQSAVAGVGLALAAKSAISAAASFNDLQTRLKLLTSEYGEYKQAQDLVAKSAKTFGLSNREAAEGIADIFARLRPLGVSLRDIESTFVGFNTVAKLSGVNSVQASAAFTQLAQALGSGALRGDEFNSIAEQVPGLLTAISQETGIAQGKLRDYAAEGKITADVTINALKRIEKDGASKIKKLIEESDVQKFKDFKDAADALSIAIGQKLLPAVTPLIAAATNLIEGFAKLPKPIQDTTIAVVALSAAVVILNPLLGTTSGLIAAMGGASIIGAAIKGLAALGEAAIATAAGKTVLASAVTAANAKITIATVSAGLLKVALIALPFVAVAGLAAVFAKSIMDANTEQETFNKTLATGTKEQLKNALATEQSNLARARSFQLNGRGEGRATFQAPIDRAEMRIKQLEAKLLGVGVVDTETPKPTPKPTPTPGGTTGEDLAALAQQQIQSLKDQASLAGALNEEEKRRVQLNIDLREIAENAKGFAEEDVHAQIAARIELEEKVNAAIAYNQALEDTAKIEEKARKDRKKAEEDARKARESDPLVQMQQELDKLVSKETQALHAASSIGNAFTDAFGDVITGTKSVSEAGADMLKSIASDFLAMAKKIIAQQLAMILYQTILNALGGGSFNSAAASPGGSAGVAGIGGGGMVSPFAEGGYVNKPTNALIGEGGEPEYVIPASKMRESMSRYSRGSRGGGVIPSDGGSSASGDGGVAVAAPIDVRYTVERINSVDYVTADQFQNGMQRAASQGAQRGEQNTLKRLQMSGSTRRRLGM